MHNLSKIGGKKREYLRYRPQLHYLLVDEGSYHDHELATLRNLTAALFRLENSRTPEDVQHVLQALIAWLQSPEQSGLRRTFTTWLKEVFLPGRMPKVKFDEIQDSQEVHSMLAERVKEWAQNWKQQGVEEGMQQGGSRVFVAFAGTAFWSDR